MNAQLEIQSLVVRCGKRAARIEKQNLNAGDCLFLTGANGVGKTSLLRALAGLRRAEAYAVRWRGRACAMFDSEWATAFSYIGHDNAMKRELTCAENLAFYATLKGKRRGQGATLSDAVANASARFGLLHCLERRCSTLSAGQTRRLSLCRLIVEQAPVWLLDEPTTALDSEAQDALNRCVAEHLTNGGVAIIATHSPMNVGRDARELHLSETSLGDIERAQDDGEHAAC